MALDPAQIGFVPSLHSSFIEAYVRKSTCVLGDFSIGFRLREVAFTCHHSVESCEAVNVLCTMYVEVCSTDSRNPIIV